MPATKTTPKAPTARQIEQVLKMQEEGAKFGDQVAKSGLTAGQVDRIVYCDRGARRLESVGVEGMTELQTFWVGAPTLEYLHDAPYAALAALVRDADLSYAEFKPVADTVMLERSDDAAVGYVGGEREQIAERIAQVAAGTWKRPTTRTTADPVQKVLAGLGKLSEEDIAALKAALLGPVVAAATEPEEAAV